MPSKKSIKTRINAKNARKALQPTPLSASQIVTESEPAAMLSVTEIEPTDEAEVLPVSLGEDGTNAEPILEAVVIEEENKGGGKREIVKSATLVMLGNLGSSLLGMVRQMTLSATGVEKAGPFNYALRIPQVFNDLIVNGSVPGALIPTFNDYADEDKRDEMRRVVFTIVNLVLLIVIVGIILFIFAAPWFVYNVMIPGDSVAEATKLQTLNLVRITILAPLALGPFAALQAALYARKEFGWTAFATAAYHVGIILGAIATALLGDYFLGKYALAFGVLLGAIGEVVLLMPGLRKQKLQYMFVMDFKHPAIRRILKLYAPIGLSFLVSAVFIIYEQNLVSNIPSPLGQTDFGTRSYNAMQYATTLIQFPSGLVASALSFAVLPTLTAHIREKKLEQFKDTLSLGFRLGLMLMIPAMAGLIILQGPITALLFQHGKATAEDASLISTALQNYAYQLPFLALDQLLIAAFYSRKQTLTPVVVGFVCYGLYAVVAIPFSKIFGMPAVVFANTVQNSMHAIILMVILHFSVGNIHLVRMLPALIKMIIATAIMGGVALGLLYLLGTIPLFSLHTLLGQALTLILVGGVASIVYFGLILLFRVEEITLLKKAIFAKLGKAS